MAITTQLQIKNHIQDWCERHLLVNSVSYGFLTDVDDLPEITPFTVYIVPGETTSPRDGVIQFNFTLVCMDLLLDDKSNLAQTISDAQTILLDIWSALMYEDQNAWSPMSGIRITPFQERFKDYCAGGSMEIAILTPQSNCLNEKAFA